MEMEVKNNLNSFGYTTFKGWTEVGTMEIQNRGTQKNVKVAVETKNREDFDGAITYSAVMYSEDNKKGKELGSLKIYRVYSINEELYCSKMGSKPLDSFNMFYKYNEQNKKVTKLYIDHIGAADNKNHIGIGTGLFQVAVEESFNHDYEGRVLLTAVGCSHGFHWKMGMRGNNDKANEEIKNVIEKAKLKSQLDGGSFSMHLSEDSIKNTWTSKIKEKPILFTTKERLSLNSI